jgi:hypothetical protein
MPIAAPRWRENWRIVAPQGATRVEVGRSAAARRTQIDELAMLPAGTPVVLLARAPGAIGRCRRFAAAAGIALEREYLTFPSAVAPCHLVEDAPASISFYVDTVLVAPPGKVYSRAIELCLSLLRRLPSWLFIRRLAPGRAAVGRRS